MKINYIPWWANDYKYQPPEQKASYFSEDTIRVGEDRRFWLVVTYYTNSSYPKLMWMPLDSEKKLIYPENGDIIIQEEYLTEKEIKELQCSQKSQEQVAQNELMKFQDSTIISYCCEIMYNKKLRRKKQNIAVYFPNDFRGEDWYSGTIVKVSNDFLWVRFHGENNHVKVLDNPKEHGRTWTFIRML